MGTEAVKTIYMHSKVIKHFGIDHKCTDCNKKQGCIGPLERAESLGSYSSAVLPRWPQKNNLINGVIGYERPKNCVDWSAMGQVVLRLKNEAGGRSLVPRGPAIAAVQTEPITGGDLSSQVFALGLCVWWCALNVVAPISAQGAERLLKGILYSPCCDVRFFSYDT